MVPQYMEHLLHSKLAKTAYSSQTFIHRRSHDPRVPSIVCLRVKFLTLLPNPSSLNIFVWIMLTLASLYSFINDFLMVHRSSVNPIIVPQECSPSPSARHWRIFFSVPLFWADFTCDPVSVFHLLFFWSAYSCNYSFPLPIICFYLKLCIDKYFVTSNSVWNPFRSLLKSTYIYKELTTINSFIHSDYNFIYSLRGVPGDARVWMILGII